MLQLFCVSHLWRCSLAHHQLLRDIRDTSSTMLYSNAVTWSLTCTASTAR
jgi:hypothetical protein